MVSAQGLRRTAQTSAEKLLISAAIAISKAGSIRIMRRDSMAFMFPICSFDSIGKFLSRLSYNAAMRGGALRFISAVIAHTIASARSGDRPGPA
jgi:hypothetical protein